MALCPKCGRRVPADSDFCPYCNEEIINNSVSKSGKIQYRRNSGSANKSQGSSRQKRLEEENHKLKRMVSIFIVSTIGLGIVAIILAIAFITTAMNVSSLSLKAKNSEDKLELLVEENSKLKEELGIDSSESKSENNNPFKADIEAAQSTTAISDKPAATYIEETTQTTTAAETTTQATTQAETTTEQIIETTTNKPEAEIPVEIPEISEEAEAAEPQEADEPVQAPIAENNIESYVPIISD